MQLAHTFKKKIIFFIAVPVILFFVLISTGILYINHWLKTPIDKNGKPQLVDIAKGSPLYMISNELEKRGIINNGLYYSLIGRMLLGRNKPKAGEYLLSPTMSPSKIMSILSKGKIYLHSITIPEGRNIYEIADLLEKKKMVDRNRFISLSTDKHFISSFPFINGESLEGYLFPSTYLFRKGEDEKVIVRKMVETFKEVVYYDIAERAASVDLTPKEVVILASLVEKETGLEEEKNIIASVFHNRLKKNMRLQCDPTVIYAIKNFDGNIRKKDLLIDSPFNTYKYAGLPPGPITNPGRTSITGVLNPSKTNYLYFVANKKGGHYFSSTIIEHNKAVRKYQLGL